ncbi:hypothetical protein DMN91_007884 [Ooceraea biroi]|uniref:Uncharacterized protein n=1 Tax=Ooceraea biroi TaxID=2015173 RepID=A0A3L8DFU6_OOCBI|nr:hypothetical protein DMN91_007884 [Ooceraea biroi]
MCTEATNGRKMTMTITWACVLAVLCSMTVKGCSGHEHEHNRRDDTRRETAKSKSTRRRDESREITKGLDSQYRDAVYLEAGRAENVGSSVSLRMFSSENLTVSFIEMQR